MLEKIKGFLNDVALEGKRISWPARRELIDSTIVVIVFIVLLSVTIMVCDEIIRMVLKFVLGGQA